LQTIDFNKHSIFDINHSFILREQKKITGKAISANYVELKSSIMAKLNSMPLKELVQKV